MTRAAHLSATSRFLKRLVIDGKDMWEPRECSELSKEIGGQFGLPIDMSSKMGGIRAISNALNDSDVARAQIATVLLGIPDQPALSKAADNRAELIKFIHDLHRSGLLKADWDPDEHPRWPAGAPDSQGGQFAPKGDDTSVDETVGDSVPARSPHDVPSDSAITPRERFYGADVPSSLQPAPQSNDENLHSLVEDSGQASATDAKDLGIYASYGDRIGDIQVASTAAIALDGPSGTAQPASWANLSRLANGALRLGSGQIITATALLTAADIQRERAAIDGAIDKFGFDPANAADVLAVRAYVRAQHFAPVNYPAVPWGGPQVEAASQSIMAIELARPGTLYLATQGDKASKRYLDVAVEAGIENGAIFESRARPPNMPAELQTTSEAARAALGLQTNDRMRAHHLIPANLWARSPITTLASQGGWQPNITTNLIALPADAATQANFIKEGKLLPIHSSNHPEYDFTAAGQMIEERAIYGKRTLTPPEARAMFEIVSECMRLRIVAGEWMPRLY